jgi:CO dehydrogenase/acetyl-CoA synthase gamma subunit (corrinoid Fe-S protein)
MVKVFRMKGCSLFREVFDLPMPGILEIPRWLPRTHCRKCNAPTCLVFAARLAEGGKTAADCPELSREARHGLEDYLGRFRFED